MNDLINQLVPILITAIIAIVAAVIKAIGDAVVKYIETKKSKIMGEIDRSNAYKLIDEAANVFRIVDEHFRINEYIGDKIQAKISMFNEILLKRFPGLTQDEIDYLRQTVAGQVNSVKYEFNSIGMKNPASVSPPINDNTTDTSN